FEAGLEVLVCINKIDRPDARTEEVLDEVYDLFIELGASDEQIEFPVLYACAKEGRADTTLEGTNSDLKPLLDAIITHVPPPSGDPDGPLQMLVLQLDHDTYVGRLAIGRLTQGSIGRQDELGLADANGVRKVKAVQLYTYEGLQRKEVERAHAGDIVAIAGIAQISIGDSLVDLEDPRPLPRVTIDQPTIGVTFLANSGPMAGREGNHVTARELRERLEREALHNVAIKLEEGESPETIQLYGRGELQLAILIEQMRREGYEMCVSKPQVRFTEIDGRRQEPFEHAQIDFPEEYMGVISEKMSRRKGQMTEMHVSGSGRIRAVFRVPSRGLIGFRSELLNDSHGEALMHCLFDGYDDDAGHIPQRTNGSIVSDRKGTTTAYALFNLQPRGKLFVTTGVEVYEGMIVG
ncbi:MAG: EF-Tu/IF-2/RF-3 family GTPase, partial [Myxococcota bacterium]|nr:EF-Tu/IF-2/RF-3 family GTPase [Myxococcota bacterium]